MLEQADRPAKRPRLDVEIKFFRSVARRLAASRASLRRDYDESEAVLQKILTEGETPLHKARVRMERIALMLCRSAFLAFESEPFRTEVRRAATAWRNLAEWENGRIASNQLEQAWQALLKQFALNTFCLLFWLAEAGLEPPLALVPMVVRLLRMLEEEENKYICQGVHGQIYPDIARFVLASKEETRAQIAGRIQTSIRDSLDGDRQAGFLFDLPFVDKIELRYISNALGRYQAGLPRPNPPSRQGKHS